MMDNNLLSTDKRRFKIGFTSNEVFIAEIDCMDNPTYFYTLSEARRRVQEYYTSIADRIASMSDEQFIEEFRR